MSDILTVKNLTVRFEDNAVLDDLSFTLGEGDNLIIIGPNGSGKTVLLKTLIGTFPHEGTIAWATDIRLGYVPQKIEADRHLPLDLKNLLAAKARVLGLSEREINEVRTAVDITPKVFETPIGHLSGGQFQKAIIAFALLGRPKVVLFDEPTASIDQPSEEQVYELVHRLQHEYNLTVILVSHDLSLVYKYATKVLCLNKRHICFGKPQDVLTPQILKQTYGVSHKFYHHAHE